MSGGSAAMASTRKAAGSAGSTPTRTAGRRAGVDAYLAPDKAALPAAWFLTAALDDGDVHVKDTVVDVLVKLVERGLAAPKVEPGVA